MSSWTDETDPPYRHTYGEEYGLTTRVVYGDNVRYGGSSFEDASGDPSSSWADETDPS